MEQTQTWSFRSDKHPRRGEDAYPVRIAQADSIWLAVFDGLGGSGSRKIPLEGVRPRSHAWLASRIASASLRDAIEEHANQLTAEDIANRLREDLSRRFTEMPATQSRIQGSSLRNLPTTMAATHLIKGESGVTCQAFWAGDSRVYALSPEYGLQQMTRDDTIEPVDAFEAIRNDSPMRNLICESSTFTINTDSYDVETPSVFIAATDGCFHYALSPQHFELLLLEAIQEATSSAEWRQATKDRVDDIRHDDASMAVAAWGWSKFEEMREAFHPRLEALKTQYLDYGEDVLGWWQVYRHGYESALATNVVIELSE
jgi:serine/threonine protein phosphatase PrpC